MSLDGAQGNWHLLADPSVRFADLGPDWNDRKASRDCKIRAHLRQLQALGLDVTITPPPETTTHRPAAKDDTGR